MTREEAIANLNMISVAFVEPVTKEQRKLIDDTFDTAIKALSQEPCCNCIEFKRYAKEMGFEIEQEPCDDAISRQAALESIEDDNRNGHYSCFASNNDAQCFKDVIRSLPSVNPQPKTGHWIAEENEEMETIGYFCSECDLPMETENQTRFCPNCGAKMIEPQERSEKE